MLWIIYVIVSPNTFSPQLLQEEQIDGALVGGASLDFESFCAIINSALEP